MMLDRGRATGVQAPCLTGAALAPFIVTRYPNCYSLSSTSPREIEWISMRGCKYCINLENLYSHFHGDAAIYLLVARIHLSTVLPASFALVSSFSLYSQ